MRALIFHGPGDVRLEEVARPEPGPGDVLVRVEAALTDGTDAKAYRRGHPVLLGPPPSPFGHEFAGVDVATGRRVVAPNSAPCGKCAPCRRGDETLCRNLFPLLNGAYAEFILVRERIATRNLLPVPDGLPAEIAAMVEPLACCLHGVERAGIDAGDTVAVLGPGPVGLMLCA
ncbi:MAG: alcohol dehydrogenase catalytic domain-containing protein, partial [Actinomycetota bacterium]|nr:alcohol dehydrogenase catalytic domain-containing protein [Actinomycetota bacterium]